MKRSIGIVIAVVLVAALGFWGWTASRHPAPAEGVQKTQVRVAQTGDFFLYAGLYVALDQGFFDKHGLAVSITNTGGDEKSAAAVLSGHAEVGIGDPTFAAIAREKGQDLRVVSALVNGAPFWGVTYDPKIAERYKATGLNGLRVATFPAPSTAYVLQKAMFKSEGAPVSIVPGAFGSLQGIVEAKKADIALELEPNVSVAQQRGGVVLYSMAEKIGDLAITGAVVDARYAAQHPQIIKSFCAALGDAYAFMRADKTTTEALLAARFKELPRPVVNAALDRMLKENIIPASPKTRPEAWKRAIDLRVGVGDLKDAAKAQDALDNGYCT